MSGSLSFSFFFVIYNARIKFCFDFFVSFNLEMQQFQLSFCYVVVGLSHSVKGLIVSLFQENFWFDPKLYVDIANSK